jgi:hypothetical protein
MAAINPPTTDDQPPARPEYEEPVDLEQDAPVDEAAEDGPPAPSATLPPISDPEGELEELEDRSLPIERLLWSENTRPDGSVQRSEQVYVQKGLTWFGKLELYGLLGQAVKVVMEGENPLGLGTVLDMAKNPRQMIADLMGDLPGADTAPDRSDENESDVELEAGRVLAAFAQVVAMAPDLLKQAYCVALAIPKAHRNWAVEWAFPNMDDEMGQDILHAFVDQNWGVMEDFFAHELPRILKRVVKARRESAGRR